MDFKSDAPLDSGSVVNVGGGGGRAGGLAVGGIGGVVILVIALLLGIDPSALLGGGSPQEPQQAPVTASECKTGADVKTHPECRWTAYMTSLNTYWKQAAGKYWQPVQMRTFSNSISTGCGQASSQVGPFYCPEDKYIYIDTDFTQQLLNQLGAKGGPAAEAYIVGHEYGHHIQNMTGILAKANQDRSTGPTSQGVRVELQADCYAGVWLNWANKNPDDPIDGVTADDLARIVDAARAVGDDHIQEQTQGGVRPDGWTHGSSAMRQKWVTTGFQTGDPNKCDTFNTNDLGQ